MEVSKIFNFAKRIFQTMSDSVENYNQNGFSKIIAEIFYWNQNKWMRMKFFYADGKYLN